MMKVRHYGLACSSEETADRFYEKLLGLKKSERKAVSAVLSETFFGIPGDLTFVHYSGEGIDFEVFFHETGRPPTGSIAHVCLEVEGLDSFLERCRAMGVPIIRAPRGDWWVTFIQDFDGNLFEIKEMKS
jgi:catechol 2,3-dioxygenase-like lactoylglutathione lyase family enzyme